MRGKITYLIILVVALGIGAVGYLALVASGLADGPLHILQEKPMPPYCTVIPVEKRVEGTSMVPLIEPGTVIQVLSGYYACHPVERDDVVLYHYAGDKSPLIKMVKGVSGDRWSLEEKGDYFLIFVDGQVLRNNAGEEYKIPAANKILPLYAKDYPIIPQNAYLILGDNPEGSLDSSQFGLISREDLLGKVIGASDH